MTKRSAEYDEQVKAAIDELQKNAEALKKDGLTLLGQSVGADTTAVIQAAKDAKAAHENYANDKASIRTESNSDSGWQKFQDDFHNFFADMRVKHDENAASRDIQHAESKAQRAEDHAANSILYALQSLSAARVALVDAIEARSYSDALAEGLDDLATTS